MWAVTAGAAAYSAGKVRQEIEEQKMPLNGVLSVLVFAAQMINFSIPATGSSLIYRYTAVLGEEAGRMGRTYSLQSAGRKSIVPAHWGAFAGQLLLRATDRAQIFSGQVVEIKTGTSLVVKAAGDVSCELPWREKIKRGQRVFFGAHPREIAALPPGKAKTNCTPVRVKSVFEIPRGFLVVGTLAGSGQEVEVEVSAAGAERLELYPGSELDLSFPPDRCWVLPAAEN